MLVPGRVLGLGQRIVDVQIDARVLEPLGRVEFIHKELVILPQCVDTRGPLLAVAGQNVEEHSPAQGPEVILEVAVQRQGQQGLGAVRPAKQVPECLSVQLYSGLRGHARGLGGGAQPGTPHQHQPVHTRHIPTVALIVSAANKSFLVLISLNAPTRAISREISRPLFFLEI